MRDEDRKAAELARRRAEVFGEVLPEATQDDRPPDSTDGDGDPGEEWLRTNVPPHHGT